MSFAMDFGECVQSLANAPAKACVDIIAGQRPSKSAAFRTRQLLAISKVLKAYREASGGDVPLPELLGRIGSELADSRATLVLWVDALESMIHEVEILYGPTPGLGSYKAAQVKAALLYAFEQAERTLPAAPLTVSGASLEIIVDWTIDGIVLILNKRQLWQLDESAALNLTYWVRLRTRAIALVLGIIGTLQRWLVGRTTMLPHVRAIAQRTVHQPGGNLLLRMREFSEFLLWSIRYRRQVLALLELVSAATIEAEAFTSMPSHEKHDYARELVLLAIAEATDDWTDEPALRAITSALIDVVIDAVVKIFRKRGFFAVRQDASRERVAAQAAPLRDGIHAATRGYEEIGS